jgi:hypothetical protein
MKKGKCMQLRGQRSFEIDIRIGIAGRNGMD